MLRIESKQGSLTLRAAASVELMIETEEALELVTGTNIIAIRAEASERDDVRKWLGEPDADQIVGCSSWAVQQRPVISIQAQPATRGIVPGRF